MINGAMEIIHRVPATNIDPLLLPESNGRKVSAFVVIAHPKRGDACDILFLEGRQIRECGHVNRDLRFSQGLEKVKSRLSEDPQHSFVHLFQAPRQIIDRFIATFHSPPCLKLQIDSLSGNQISRSLESARCKKGVFEIDTYGGRLPSMLLFPFQSKPQLLAHCARLKEGRLLLYDTNQNKAPLRRPPGRKTNSREPEPDMKSPAREESANEKSSRQLTSVTPVEERDTEYILLFEGMLSSFRREASDFFGSRLEAVIRDAEMKVRDFTPGLNLKELSEATAPAILDVMMAVIEGTSILKRARLKIAVQSLVSDLYSKHFKTLEKHDVVDKMEQFYYQLK